MPWKPSYGEEVAATRTYGVEAQAKLAYPLDHSDYFVIFEEDGKSARLIASCEYFLFQDVGETF
jgi:hypothetical protein